jgi:ParB-like chromosome segregation protein Spo0J
MSQWRNRIIGYGTEKPDQLLANPNNYRIHPKNQQDALSGVLENIGVVQNILVNRRTGFVVDGHLRVSMALSAGQAELPVTYVDLTDEEEAAILATYDPLSAMAAKDDEAFAALKSGMSDAYAQLVEMAGQLDNEGEHPEHKEREIECPECGHKFSV